jgi:hypothetical protein
MDVNELFITDKQALVFPFSGTKKTTFSNEKVVTRNTEWYIGLPTAGKKILYAIRNLTVFAYFDLRRFESFFKFSFLYEEIIQRFGDYFILRVFARALLPS